MVFECNSECGFVKCKFVKYKQGWSRSCRAFASLVSHFCLRVLPSSIPVQSFFSPFQNCILAFLDKTIFPVLFKNVGVFSLINVYMKGINSNLGNMTNILSYRAYY